MYYNGLNLFLVVAETYVWVRTVIEILWIRNLCSKMWSLMFHLVSACVTRQKLWRGGAISIGSLAFGWKYLKIKKILWVYLWIHLCSRVSDIEKKIDIYSMTSICSSYSLFSQEILAMSFAFASQFPSESVQPLPESHKSSEWTKRPLSLQNQR